MSGGSAAARKTLDAIVADADGSIAVGTSISPEDVVRLVSERGLHHVVQNDGPSFQTELGVARLMDNNLEAFLDAPLEAIFGLRSADAPARASLHLTCSVDEKKSDILEKFEEFVLSLPGARQIRDEAHMIADELYTNGAKLGFDPARLSKDSKLVRPGKVELFAQADAHRLVFGVRDTYGLLRFEQILSRLMICFENGVGSSIKQGEGGAGIGSFMVFNSCISYYAGVERGRRTVVCVALPLGIGRRDGTTLPKNMHLASD